MGSPLAPAVLNIELVALEKTENRGYPINVARKTMILRIIETAFWPIVLTAGIALAFGDFVIPNIDSIRGDSRKLQGSLQGKKPPIKNQALESGRQSTITSKEFLRDISRFSAEPNGEKSPKTVKMVYDWMQNNFQRNLDMGKSIGQRNIDQVYTSKEMRGCHDYALIFSGIMRQMGIPSRMVDTMDIGWARKFSAHEPTNGYEGHVFSEVYINGQWSLVDPTNGRFIIDYDPKNPMIPISFDPQSPGHYVMRKGKDTWDYGIHNNAELNELMEKEAVEKADDLQPDHLKKTTPTYLEQGSFAPTSNSR